MTRVYAIPVQVGILRGSEHLSILPPRRAEEKEERDKTDTNPPSALNHPTVHVIAGGGSGEMLMRALADLAIPFVAGALNIGDSDHTLALRLASKVITEQPFAPITPAALQQVRASLAQVQILVLCPTAIGPGNLALIEEATQAAKQGLPVIVLNSSEVKSVCLPRDIKQRGQNTLDHTGIVARDYTEGKGVKLMEILLQAGAIVTTSVTETLEVVKRHLEEKPSRHW